jgi:hypothetical protein
VFNAAEVTELRRRHARGETMKALAAEYRVSAPTIARYVHGVEPDVAGGARAAVDEFLGDLGGLSGERKALAAIARELATRIDSTRSASSAAVGAKELAVILSRLAAASEQEDAHGRARRSLRAVGL